MTKASRRVVLALAVLLVLALVFASYLRPDLVVALATAAWNCF